MHSLPNGIVATKRKRDITDASTGSDTRKGLLHFIHSIDKRYCILIVLFDTGCNGEDIEVKNNVVRRETKVG